MWRGVSIRQLALLLLGPLIVETVWTLLVFWMSVQVTDLGYTPRVQSLVVLLPSLGYACGSLIAGRWITQRIAPRMLWLMLVTVAGLGLFVIYFKNFHLFLCLGPLMGFCIGHYYLPFQINMAHVQPFRTLAWTIAFYNIAWGLGGSIGPFLAGLLQRHPPGLTTAVLITLAGLHASLVYIAATAPQPTDEHRPAPCFASTASQRYFSRIAFAAAALMMRGSCFTLIPAFAQQRHWSVTDAGLLVFLSFGMIPLGAMLWAKLRHVLIRPWIMIGSLGIGALGMGAMPWTTTWTQSLACLIAVGIAESCTVFHTVYYANADPAPHSRARSIASVEVIAGLATMIGPALLGLLAWTDATHPRPWLVGSFLLLAVAGYITRKQRPGVAVWAYRQP